MILYIHGFNSGADPTSAKVMSLGNLGQVLCMHYDSFSKRTEILDQLLEQVPVNQDLVFAGTSLGGYFAALLAKHFRVPSILINPAHSPDTTLMQCVGVPQVNFVSGETKVLSTDACDSYCGESITEAEAYEVFPLVILAMDDELLDAAESRELFTKFPLFVCDTGGHRFENPEIFMPAIEAYLGM